MALEDPSDAGKLRQLVNLEISLSARHGQKLGGEIDGVDFGHLAIALPIGIDDPLDHGGL